MSKDFIRKSKNRLTVFVLSFLLCLTIIGFKGSTSEWVTGWVFIIIAAHLCFGILNIIKMKIPFKKIKSQEYANNEFVNKAS